MAKYTFIKDYSIVKCISYNSLGVCLQEQTVVVAKKGNVIEGNYVFDTRDNSATINAKIDGQMYGIPPSYLKENTASTPGTNSGTNGTEATQTYQENWFKKYVTKTNVIIGLSLLAVTLIILKIFKVF